jgi:dihydroflavonol-4-reductase
MLSVVTGATGHIGINLVRELLSRHQRVRGVVHRDAGPLEGLPVEKIEGDILEADSLVRAFAGADLVFHGAGAFSLDPRDGERLASLNVSGTRNVVEACLACKVRRLVHFSSIHALSEEPLDQPVTEENPLVGPEADLAYSRSKALSEEVALQAVGRGLEVVVVSPSGIIGPYDHKLSDLGNAIRELAAGTLLALVPGGYDFVDVRDVVRSAAVAAERGRSGERYLLTGRYAQVSELAALVTAVTGTRMPRWICPLWLAKSAAPMAVLWARMTGGRAKFTPVSLRVLEGNGQASHAKAARELGHSPRPLRDSVAQTIEWLREAGFLVTDAAGRLRLGSRP